MRRNAGNEKREIDMDKGEETADDEMSENSDVRETCGDLGHLYGPESCMRCQGNPLRSQQQAREKGKATSELEFWRTSGIVRLWTRSLERRSGKLVSGPMVGFRDLERRIPGKKDQVVWRNVGEDRERDSRVMAGACLRAKGDTVAVKMKVGGGGLGERKEEDRK